MLHDQSVSRRQVITSVLGAFVMSLCFTGCGEEDLSKANPKPEEKRVKYREIHPPEPGKKAGLEVAISRLGRHDQRRSAPGGYPDGSIVFESERFFAIFVYFFKEPTDVEIDSIVWCEATQRASR